MRCSLQICSNRLGSQCFQVHGRPGRSPDELRSRKARAHPWERSRVQSGRPEYEKPDRPRLEPIAGQEGGQASFECPYCPRAFAQARSSGRGSRHRGSDASSRIWASWSTPITNQRVRRPDARVRAPEACRRCRSACRFAPARSRARRSHFSRKGVTRMSAKSQAADFEPLHGACDRGLVRRRGRRQTQTSRTPGGEKAPRRLHGVRDGADRSPAENRGDLAPIRQSLNPHVLVVGKLQPSLARRAF